MAAKEKRSAARRRTGYAVLLATTVLSTTLVAGTSASADPQQPGDAAGKLRELAKRAEVVTEQVKQAKENYAAHQDELRRAKADTAAAENTVAQARQRQEALRGKVDRLSASAYEGTPLSNVSVLMTSETPRALLDRASALNVLADDKKSAFDAFSAATSAAEDGQRQASAARDRATNAVTEAGKQRARLVARKKAMDAEIAKVRSQYDSLSSAQRADYAGPDSDVGPLAGSGAAIAAVNAALGKQGSPYVFGAKGPSTFDCSGLVAWAYRQAGVSVPAGTQSQVGFGRSVSESEMRPGDVVFYYSSASHDGIYIGGGKVVHAPTEGQNVKVADYRSIGDVHSVRRFTT
ncbi:C40 family peptidase [Sciscionella marina]|uniref:C40 family peptidase n=1 Tax=Sciscionella marina TaxID=508770 RepID=UPI000379AD1F|nr:C40 family peptidase [Sciscionella marina]